MRKVDALILFLGIVTAIIWVIFSSKDGFKGTNATIIARSIAITATIDGQIENNPPEVGAQVKSNELLARVYNGRFDRSRLIEFDSEIAYLHAEIANIREQQQALEVLQKKFKQRAASYSAWMLSDLRLQHTEVAAELDVAKARKRLEYEEVERATQLYNKQLTSEVDMQVAKTQAEIADAQVNLNAAQLERSALILQTVEREGVFFEDGDTSYWAKMVDTLSVQRFNNLNRISLLEALLIQAQARARGETTRINSSFAEEHRAPFSGMVNARYVTQGTRVTSGTNLLQVLDCTHPAVIIPIPENRVSEFSVGLRVTVYPIDSEEALPGRISYVSSGPMIGGDTSIQIQQEITLDGNRAIVSLDEDLAPGKPQRACETARKAVVVIHTKSIFDTISAWI